jgi:hypothetical protein
MPPKHPEEHRFVNNERKLSLKDIGEQLQQIGTRLAEKGRFKLNKTEVAPPDPCELKLRYERMPRGELSLKIELKWWPEAKNAGREDDDLDVVIS